MLESRRFRWIRRAALGILTAFVTLPLYVMALTSLRSQGDLARPFRWFPHRLTVSPYDRMWTSIPLAHYLANSGIVAASTAVAAALVSVPAGYALARHRFAGRSLAGTGLLLTQGVPGLFFLLPVFLLYAQVGNDLGIQLVGSYIALIVTDIALVVPFGVWLLAAWFTERPTEYEEAALALGVRSIRVFLRVTLPGAGPAVGAVLAFAFAVSWGDVLFAAALTDTRTTTVAVGLPALAGGPTPSWNELMAASLLASVPVVLAWALIARVVRRLLI